MLRDGAVLHTVAHQTTEEYSSWLLPAVDEALEAAGVVLRDADLYAVPPGPGSFTGVRIGLTTVKAWNEVFGKPIAAVTRLEALARQAVATAPFVAAAVNGLRGQIYAAIYKRSGNLNERIGEEMAIGANDFVSLVGKECGSQPVDWISTDAAMIEETPEWEARLAGADGVRQNEEIVRVPCVLAPAVGKLGLERAIQGKTVDALSLDAQYVRRPDAEVLWKGGMATSHGR
ncbi:MAG: tRNA (adenosine(37)-N6)-threonylcarbamoyltransferase complex dimerization subunit type 1 TsaB [Acidobacteriota bacterium]|nr:tRNA (adenosine(37)-N6)-threonylcarbamoyltransferase complex dimerization subunit type 1 TsaB [Acidobacteriota bacterium]